MKAQLVATNYRTQTEDERRKTSDERRNTMDITRRRW